MFQCECPKCKTTGYPQIESPRHYAGTRSQVTCPNCGHQLGSLDTQSPYAWIGTEDPLDLHAWR